MSSATIAIGALRVKNGPDGGKYICGLTIRTDQTKFLIFNLISTNDGAAGNPICEYAVSLV